MALARGRQRSPLCGNGPVLRDDVGSASIHHSGEKGSLVARALIADENSGDSLGTQSIKL
jgi:hypothetical protein